MYHDISSARLLSRRSQGRTVMTVCGELDMATTADLRDQILTVLQETAAPVIIDLSGVTFCDASGLALLVGAQRRAKRLGLAVVLAGPPRTMSKLLRITGLDRVFTIYPTLAAARLGQESADRPAVA
jgi:anti-sigma B factor antagonist